MSMRAYAVDEYGLVLSKDTLKEIASKAIDDFNETTWEQDVHEYLWDMDLVEYFAEFSGETIQVDDIGKTDYNNADFYNDEEIFYVYTLKAPELFRAPYGSITEIIKEFRDRLGKYLPEDFDYRNNFKHIVGTYYG